MKGALGQNMSQKRKYGDRWIDPYWGYIWVRIENHPLFQGKKTVLEHRLLVAEKLGRPLLSSELVHHYDDIKTNNHIDNLILHTRASHAALHSKGKEWSEESRKKASASAIKRSARPEHKLLLKERAERQHREGKLGKATWKPDTIRTYSEEGLKNQRENALKLNEEGRLGPKSWKGPHPIPQFDKLR